MTANEQELIKMILETDKPEQAVMTFAAIIDLLKQREAFEGQASAYPQTSYQTIR